MRWSELAAFTVMFRSHLGTLPDKNWQIYNDTHTLRHFFNMSIVFQSWDFYRQRLMNEAEHYGWPVARHMMLIYPDNPAMYIEDLRYQFMIGTELLVAPVLHELIEETRVFLPQNTNWIHLWSGNPYTGMHIMFKQELLRSVGVHVLVHIQKLGIQATFVYK
jgi:alpha-glucosidase